jgi:hypothetical protein
MKNLIAALAIVMLATTAHAGIELEVNYMESFDPNKELSYTNEIPQIKAVYRFDNNIRLWLSYQRDHMDWVGAYAYDLDIFAGGVGYEHKWNDVFSSYIDGGIAFIQHGDGFRGAKEAQFYYQMSLLPWDTVRLWDEYTLEVEPAILLTFGSKIEPWQNIGFNLGVQAMLYEFNIKGRPYNWQEGQGYWTFDNDGVQLSAFMGLYYRF